VGLLLIHLLSLLELLPLPQLTSLQYVFHFDLFGTLENVIGLIQRNAFAANPVSRLFVRRRSTNTVIGTRRRIVVARAHVFVQGGQEQAAHMGNGRFIAPVGDNRILFTMVERNFFGIYIEVGLAFSK
jgi:hypothetical protein